VAWSPDHDAVVARSLDLARDLTEGLRYSEGEETFGRRSRTVRRPSHNRRGRGVVCICHDETGAEIKQLAQALIRQAPVHLLSTSAEEKRMDGTAKNVLVGRIVVRTTDERDLWNSFFLVAAESEWEATLVPLDSEVEWDSADSHWGLERPRAHRDPAAELAACDRPLVAKKRFVDGERVCLQAGGLDYCVWDGIPCPCRYL
jgi:hypothetical protein